MGRKDLEHLVGKLRSMHLVVTGAVEHLYRIQRALDQAGEDRAWLSPELHCKIAEWRMLAEQIANQTTHLTKIIRREPTHLGLCNASVLRTRGVCIYPSCSGKDLVWHHPWTEEIFANLIPFTNTEVGITKSDLQLAALIIHEATLIVAVHDVSLDAPCSGSDNTQPSPEARSKPQR